MKKIFFVLIIIYFPRQILGQTNLVPNWSFETYTSCPDGSMQLPKATFWNCASSCGEYWNVCGTPPYNVPSSIPFYYQLPKDGDAFITLQTWSANYREYAQTKLLDTLESGLCYYVEFYTSVANGCQLAINNISANLSSVAYSSPWNALNIPQHITRGGNPVITDTMNWVQVSGIYQAMGDEIYLTIGNMKDDTNTTIATIQPTGYGGVVNLFDAVSVYAINPSGSLPWAYRDTTVNFGDSVYIGNYLGGSFSSNWYLQSGGFIGSGSGVFVKPAVTSNDIVQFTLCGITRTDTLTVTVLGGAGINNNEIKNSDFLISPNPTNNVLNIEILNREIGLGNSTIRIFDVFGREIKNFALLNKRQEIELQDLKAGIYYLQLLRDNRILFTRKIIKL